MRGGLEVRVEGTRVVQLLAVPPVAAKVLPGPVLVLVGSAAGLLEGDTVSLRVDLAPGAQLTVITTAAAIAHPCRAGGQTAMEVDCRLGPGARLAWLPEPTVACGGCHHRSRSRISLAPGAAAVWLESLTLGRSGETPGRVEQRLDVELDGTPLLRECLGVNHRPGWDGPAILGPARHVAALHLLGRRPAAGSGLEAPGVMALAGPGATTRILAARAHQLSRRVAAVQANFLHALALTDATSEPPPAEKAPVHV